MNDQGGGIRPALKPVFVGGATIRAINGNDVARDIAAIRIVEEGAAVLVDGRQINIQPGDVTDIAAFQLAQRLQQYFLKIRDGVASGTGEFQPLR